MELIKDAWEFITALTYTDIFFFASIICLLILIIVLIYYNKIDKEIKNQEQNPGNNNDDTFKIEEKPTNNSSSLKDIVDKINLEAPHPDVMHEDEEGELIDLKGLTKKLEEEKDNNRINFTEYEKDQEEKAIISYDELLKNQNRYTVNYEKEVVMDDLVVKKVDLNNLINKEEKEVLGEAKVFSYDKEEAFLSALKELNHLLN